jgi:hydrogenase maturation protease
MSFIVGLLNLLHILPASTFPRPAGSGKGRRSLLRPGRPQVTPRTFVPGASGLYGQSSDLSGSRREHPLRGGIVVIGVGNEFRRDDGAGPQLVARLRQQAQAGVDFVVSDGDPIAMIEAWDGAELAIVVDAVRVDPAAPGRLYRLILDRDGLAPEEAVSSHGLGLGEAIGLAQVLGRMPARLIVHAVEAGDVGPGTGLTPPVAAATSRLAAAVLRDMT